MSSINLSINDVSKNTDTYTYYPNGNLAGILRNGSYVQEFVYDECDRLQRDYDYAANRINVYNYNSNSANIGTRVVYDLSWNYIKTEIYSYTNPAWPDQLTSYKGQTITYDNVGNPLSYRDGMQFTWQNGRELKRVDNVPNYGYVEMEYDYQGLRTKKSNADFSAYYLWEGNTLMAEERGGYLIWYYYDESGVCDESKGMK